MVKTLFDTSVLVTAFWVNHPIHSACLHWLKQAKTGSIQGVIVNHTLAELYATLTALPINHRLSPQVIHQLITENLKSFEVIPLSVDDYYQVINQMVNLNLTSGAIYDALIAQVAIKVNIDRLLTLNPKHFNRFGDKIAQLVTVPT